MTGKASAAIATAHARRYVLASFVYPGNIMAKLQRRFACQLCGSVTSKWQGQCVDCGEWNTLVEEVGGGVVTPFAAKHDLRSGGRPVCV